MGGALSSETSSQTKQNSEKQNLIEPVQKYTDLEQETHNANDSELFDKIAQLSNNLLMEYGNYYLKPNFVIQLQWFIKKNCLN